MFLKKNTAGQTVAFCLVNASTGAALTGATVSVRRCIDGTFAAGGGTVTEDAGGLYKFAPAQADTNGDQIAYYFTASSAVPVCLNVRTTAADMSDAVRFGLTALPNAAAGASGGVPTGDGSGRVTVGTNADKTGYSLSQSFPSNFASLSIDVSGKVLLQATQTGVTIPTVTTVTNRVTANTDQLAGQTVTAASGVTFPASVGTSTYTGADTSGTTTLLSRVAGTVPLAADYSTARAAKLDNLDAAVSTLATAAQLAKVLAAVYDTATVSGSQITLSNGAVLTVTASGRTRTGG